MIAFSMVLRGHPMSLGGVFMMLSCFVMRVFCHVGYPLESIFRLSKTPMQVMNHWTSKGRYLPKTASQPNRLGIGAIRFWTAAHRCLVHFQEDPILAVRANAGERRERKCRRIAGGAPVRKNRRQRLDDKVDDALDLTKAGFRRNRGDGIEDRTERSSDLDRAERP